MHHIGAFDAPRTAPPWFACARRVAFLVRAQEFRGGDWGETPTGIRAFAELARTLQWGVSD
jgi:hypothetical protein